MGAFITVGIIRFLLALSVVASHSAPILGFRFVASETAVQAFYIISGFYMSLILNEKYPATPAGNWLFYGNRFLRIYPIYWLVLGLTLGLYILSLRWPQIPTQVGQAQLLKLNGASFDIKAFLIFANFAIFGLDWGMFLRVDGHHLLPTENFASYDPPAWSFYLVPQAWTLGIEVAVYVVAPFLFRKSISALLLVIVASFSLRAIFALHGYALDPWSYRFLPFEIGMFATGAISYKVYAANVRLGTKWAAIIFGYIILLIIAYWDLPNKESWIPGLSTDKMIFLTSLAVALPFIFNLTSNWRFDRRIGELSYPIYLSHLLVFTVLGHKFGAGNWKLPLLTLAMSITILLVVEFPLNALRTRRIRRQMPGSESMGCTTLPVASE